MESMSVAVIQSGATGTAEVAAVLNVRDDATLRIVSEENLIKAARNEAITIINNLPLSTEERNRLLAEVESVSPLNTVGGVSSALGRISTLITTARQESYEYLTASTSSDVTRQIMYSAEFDAIYSQLDAENQARIRDLDRRLRKQNRTDEDNAAIISDMTGAPSDIAEATAQDPEVRDQLDRLAGDPEGTTQAAAEQRLRVQRSRERGDTAGAEMAGLSPAELARRGRAYYGFARSALTPEQRRALGITNTVSQSEGDDILRTAAAVYSDAARYASARGNPNSEDGAAIRFAANITTRVTLDVIEQSVQDRARARREGRAERPETRSILEGSMEEREEALMEVMRRDPRVAGASRERLREMARSSLREYDADPNSVKPENAGATANRITSQLLGQVQRDGARIAETARLATDEVREQNAAERERLRRDEGISTVELEFSDMVRGSRDFRERIAHGRSAEAIVNDFEGTGLFENWNGRNRQGTDIGTELMGLISETDRDRFNAWNNRNMARIDLNGDGQISSREASLAVMLNDFIKDPRNKALIDTNGNGSLSAAEVRRGMLYVQARIDVESQLDTLEANRWNQLRTNNGTGAKLFDRDGNGQLTLDEIMRTLREQGVDITQYAGSDGVFSGREITNAMAAARDRAHATIPPQRS